MSDQNASTNNEVTDSNLEIKKWVAKSLALNATASKVRATMQESVDSFAGVLSEESQLIGLFTANIICNSLTLLNQSAETIVKARIVQNQHGNNKGKKLKFAHGSVAVHAKKAGINLSDDEVNTLNELYKAVEFSRIHQLETSDQQVIKTVANHYLRLDEYFETVNLLLERICKLVAVKIDQIEVAS